ncbi:MAG: alpha/beta fold hydrolase [Thermoleophilia bacterium]|nr:alpha/beta fold hydrolase [Thermoleophilia bacterium]
MNTGKARFVCDDGVELAYHWWLPDVGGPAKVLAILHGIGLEGSPYQSIGAPLSEAGTAVYSLDLRGHGLSGGARGDMGSNRKVLADIEAFLSMVRAQHEDVPVYLFGESMGGLFALAFAATHQKGLSGLILAAPALRLRLRHFFSWSNLRLPWYVVFCRRPFLSLNDQLLDISCCDEWFKHYRRTDPRPLPAVSVCYLARIGTFIGGWCFRYARRLRTPTLIIQGGHDDLLHPAAAHRLFGAIGVPDRELIVLDDAWHTLPWDPATPMLVEAMIRWLARH